YHARLTNETFVNAKNLAKMEEELPIAAGLLPEYLELNAIGYACTSGATIIGEDRVKAIMKESHPDIPSSNPMTAAKAALKALGVERLGLLTPYTPEVTVAMQQRFEEAGIAITVVGSFYEENDILVGQIDPKSILKAAVALGKSELCDGIFISCTSLRTAEIIDEAEAELGKPVTASNHALAWHLLRLVGIDDKLAGFGRLFNI
ncbi:Asp/Glu racemase, partial [Ascidiaceihabitans sp.]|nr:Asp/Glu racemase [Ascidiaceihabitans sp.]